MAMPTVDSVMALILPQQLPTNIDPNIKGYIEQISNSILQLQSYIEQYCGITQKQGSTWASYSPVDTLREHQVNRLYLKAGEAIAYGAAVSILNVAGTPVFQNANATDATKFAVGFCSTIGGIPANAYGEVIVLRGIITGVSGLTPGVRYFLNTVNGQIVNAEPNGVGNISQFVGIALGTNILFADVNLQFKVITADGLTSVITLAAITTITSTKGLITAAA